jgi:hypothetical protein
LFARTGYAIALPKPSGGTIGRGLAAARRSVRVGGIVEQARVVWYGLLNQGGTPMRHESTVLAALILLGAATASAADLPDMVGSWKVETPIIVTGAGAHHPTNAPPPAEAGKPRVRLFTGTMTIAGQEGDRF